MRAAATTCRRSAGRRAPRRRAASGAARRRAPRPGGPTSAKRGTCRVDETKRALPRPPWPPLRRARRGRPACARSAIRPPSSAKTCVPTGTRSSASAPFAPCLRAPRPFSPRAALIERRRCSAERSRSDGSATQHDVAAVAAVAAVGAALRHELLAAEAEAAVAALARLDVDRRAVAEHGRNGSALVTKDSAGRDTVVKSPHAALTKRWRTSPTPRGRRKCDVVHSS